MFRVTSQHSESCSAVPHAGWTLTPAATDQDSTSNRGRLERGAEGKENELIFSRSLSVSPLSLHKRNCVSSYLLLIGVVSVGCEKDQMRVEMSKHSGLKCYIKVRACD